MNLYVIVIYLLNATTGDIDSEYVSKKPLTIEMCNLALTERGPILVKDGLAQYAVCRKVEDETSV